MRNSRPNCNSWSALLFMAVHSFAVPELAMADSFELQLGASYQCADGSTFQVFSCARAGNVELCDVQSTLLGQDPQRGQSTRQLIMMLLPHCQTGATAQARDRAAPTGRASGPRFTLRLGQGFRFKDGKVVARQDDSADIVFKYLPPQVGGMALRYNPISQQVEQGLEPTLTHPMPLLLSPHIAAFERKPEVAAITTGDMAGYASQAPLHSKSRYLLLQDKSGEPYLLTLDELDAVEGKYDDWRIGFAYERVKLPLGRAGGRISTLFPGRLIFRDWYRTKMIMNVDLTTGQEQALADGILPSTVGGKLLGYGDSSGAYVVRDANGKVLSTIRFNERIMGPVLSPDGTRLAATVYREGPGRKIGNTVFPGAAVLSTAVFDLNGRQLIHFVGVDDAVWTPDGKLIATGGLYDPGLFELDPATQSTRTIHAKVASPMQPAVSPDGRSIAFVTGNKIWLIDRDGGNMRQLFPDSFNQQRPVFSPDGSKIAAVICNQMAVSASGEVFVIDIASRQPTPLRTSTGVALVPDDTSRLSWIQ